MTTQVTTYIQVNQLNCFVKGQQVFLGSPKIEATAATTTFKVLITYIEKCRIKLK